MRVIFVEDHGSSKIDDVKNVKSGYARFLIQYEKAIPATEKLEAEANQRREERVKKEEEIRANAQKVAAQVKDIVLEFTEKANEEGQLFGSISEQMIAESLEKEHKLEIKKDQVLIKEQIKSCQEHEVTIKLAPKVEVKVKVVVKAESAE